MRFQESPLKLPNFNREVPSLTDEARSVSVEVPSLSVDCLSLTRESPSVAVDSWKVIVEAQSVSDEVKRVIVDSQRLNFQARNIIIYSRLGTNWLFLTICQAKPPVSEPETGGRRILRGLFGRSRSGGGAGFLETLAQLIRHQLEAGRGGRSRLDI